MILLGLEIIKLEKDIMMHTKKYIALLILVLFFSACKKDEIPPDETGSIVFGVVGIINNKPVTIEAGVNNYYMYTSYAFNEGDSIYTFTGTLSQVGCQTCPKTLSVDIRDRVQRADGEPVDIENLIMVGQMKFRKNITIDTVPSDSIRLKFTAKPEGFYWPFALTWTFNGYPPSNSDTPSITVPLGTYQLPVCLIVTDDKSNIGSICDTLNIYPDTNCTADFNIVSKSSNFDSMEFLPTSSIGSHFWDFGDGNTQNTSGFGKVPHIYKGADSSSNYLVRLTSSSGGCKQTITKKVSFENPPDTPAANYSYEFIKLPPSISKDSLDLSRVTITWIDEAGHTYTSRNDNQPSTSTFEIISTETYSDNEKGEKTFKFTARVSCRLYNGASFIEMRNTIIKFAVAYP